MAHVPNDSKKETMIGVYVRYKYAVTKAQVYDVNVECCIK